MYTGRFAYVLGDKAKAMEDFSSVIDQEIKDDKISLLEEYNHNKLFSRSISALYINGLRWIVRILFQISNNYWIAFDYYKAKSIFFGLSYEFHKLSVKQGKVDFYRLLLIDFEVIKESLQYSRIYLLFFPLFPFLIFIGFVISVHFSVSIKNPKGNFQMDISKYGYVGIEKKIGNRHLLCIKK